MTQDELDALRSLPPGDRANRSLFEHLLRPRFLGYWTFSEPVHRHVELSDAVVIWKDTLILFEVKTRGVKRPADVGWLREKIGEAVDQLNKKVILFKSGGVALRNEWRGEVEVNPEKIKDYYGVIVLMAGFVEPFEWRELADEEYRRATIPIQVFTLFDLAELLRFVDTPIDFIVYFENRARYARTSRVFVGREQDTFAEVIGRLHELEELKDASHREKIQTYWLDRANAIQRSQLATEQGYRDWAASKLIDFGFVPSERKAVVDARGKPIRSPEHDQFVEVIEVLAEMSRNRRTEYGRRWLMAAEKAITTGSLFWRSSYSPSRSCSYVWAASELGREPNQERIYELAVEAMLRNGTRVAIALGASAASIISTFDWLVSVCKGEVVGDPDENLSLAPVVAWVRNGEFR
jgi:hypothetical protein